MKAQNGLLQAGCTWGRPTPLEVAQFRTPTKRLVLHWMASAKTNWDSLFLGCLNARCMSSCCPWANTPISCWACYTSLSQISGIPTDSLVENVSVPPHVLMYILITLVPLVFLCLTSTFTFIAKTCNKVLKCYLLCLNYLPTDDLHREYFEKLMFLWIVTFHLILTFSYLFACRRTSNTWVSVVSFWNAFGKLERSCHTAVCSCTLEKKDSTVTISWNTVFWLLGSLDILKNKTTDRTKWDFNICPHMAYFLWWH